MSLFETSLIVELFVPSSLLSMLLLLLLSHFSCVRLCANPQTAAHQAPPSLGASRQEHWSGLPLPSPLLSMTRSKKLVQFQIGQIDTICHRLKCIYIIAKWIIIDAEVIE